MAEPYTSEAPEAAEPGPRARARAARAQRQPGGRFAAFLCFVLPAVAALALTLHRNDQRQLWRDEHATWWAATLSFADLGSLIRGIDVVFTPYYVLMHLWVMVAGDDPAMLRVPSAAAMGASAGLLALLGRRLFGAQAGMAAGLAFAVIPAVTRYGQEFRPYAFAVAAVLLSTLLLARALDRPSFKVWVAYTLSIPLVGWSHLASMAVIAAHLLMIEYARRRGDVIAGWAFAAAGGLGLCFVLPMAAQGSGQSGQIAWNNPVFDDLLNYPADLFGGWGVAVPVMGLGVLGLCFAGRYALPLATWAVLPPVVTYLTADQLHLFLPRYLLFTVPAWLLLAAVALARVAGPLTGRKAGRGHPGRLVIGWLLAGAALAALVTQALPGIREAREQPLGEPDFRAAAELIRDDGRARDGIAFSGQLAERRAMDYELRDDADRPKDVLLYRTPQELGSYGAGECPRPAKCLAKTDRLWVVTTSDPGNPFHDMPAATRAVLKRDFRAVRTEKLDDVQVLLLKRTREVPGTSREDSPADRKVHT
ncbi:hypothetical protein G5C51_23255 [Streptomyces sp. A7024]|uniref:Glycosyltransferase RgtA/B/C/D-like domain-containing protein n=1 Tax=Streptomyces coryli TaxID=1128680 RepID=A0A6G4U4Z6_9ACTN|nr:glycosyltransferase family 39 protein [Streptomyces coryli]NGN66810.1 hypothetical protein [Streptomyces coryli]